ncbi:universal stress protein [Embleya sp. NPDC059237]|uniref:universal stress protein n=1 Tax=Embleya sp. NPDC059237 TaxID=3346784 RepID=UPI00367A1337
MTARAVAVPLIAHTFAPATVVVGVDGSQASVSAVAFACEEATLRGASLSACTALRSTAGHYHRRPGRADERRADPPGGDARGIG